MVFISFAKLNRRLAVVTTRLSILLLLAACAPPSKVKVVERQTIDPRIETERIGGTVIRIVQSGDTLHAIAFASGLDVNQVAAWNNVADTSRLQVGQRIRLTRPLGFVAPDNSSKAASQQAGVTRKQTDSSKAKPAVSTVSGSARKSKPTSAKAGKAASPDWVWPTAGSVIGRFASSQTQQGIDIKGRIGQPVVAAAAGEVVYVGNGLKGYGNLVIIKHSERFLSAYAHNQETFVREGQQVAVRHSIGSVGLDKQRRSALHFQIRRDGEPVNPLAYLPKK